MRRFSGGATGGADTALMNAVGWVGLGATVFSIGQSIPQVRRVFRVSTAGVSVATWALTSIAITGWFVWGVREHAAATIATNIVCGPLAWAVFVRLTPPSANSVGDGWR